MNQDLDNSIWDVIIIGAGAAGCNAAIVLARCRRRVLIIDEGKQRNILSQGMHGYLTRDGILPTDYLALAHKELERYNINLLKGKAVEVKKLATHGFEVLDNAHNKYLCRRLLLATGVTDNVPDIPGMKELWGCGVYHCPHCDGYEYTEKIIGLYANRYNGYGMALALRELSSDITLFTDGARYLRSAQRQHLAARGIKIISKKITSLSQADKKLTGVMLQDGETITCDGLFVEHGHRVNGELLNQLGCACTQKGAAITNRQQQTNVPGVYVAGDASFDIHFVIVAAAEGAKAAVSINNDLLKIDNAYVENTRFE